MMWLNIFGEAKGGLVDLTDSTWNILDEFPSGSYRQEMGFYDGLLCYLVRHQGPIVSTLINFSPSTDM